MAELTFTYSESTIEVPIPTTWQPPEARIHGRARPEIAFDEIAVTANGGFEGTASLSADVPWLLLPSPAEAADGALFAVDIDTTAIRDAGGGPLIGTITASKEGYDDGTCVFTVSTRPERRA